MSLKTENIKSGGQRRFRKGARIHILTYFGKKIYHTPKHF